MLNEQPPAGWSGAGRAAGLVALVLLGFADTTFGDTTTLVTSSAKGGSALAAAALWLTAGSHARHRLSSLALVVAAGSLGVTALLIAAEADGLWGWAEVLALVLLVITVTHRGKGWATAPAVVALGLALCVQPYRTAAEHSVPSLSDHAGLFGSVQCLAAAVAVGVGLYLRFQAASHERLLAAVRAEQRAEFARDLHDFVAHHVTGIVVQAQGARYVAELAPERALDALEQIESAGTRTLSAMRRMVGVLREASEDVPLAPPVGLSELAPMVKEFTAAGGPRVELSVDDVAEDLPVEVASTLHRVVMEALTNVRKHAGAARVVEVDIRRTPDRLSVRVADDGAARPARWSRSGFGLAGLAERVGTIGGRIEAGPGTDGGWVVTAVLPVKGCGVSDEDGAV
ncbi:sensor histidine kinase [Streptomyces sp. NPDC015242]|uniref:sensor histidine kinase n=1 Tax=unclassified Streptomyces TaxID=2593676 RepID=UPI0037023172